MIISGMQKLTLLDYPTKTACMIFTGGCNFNCSYCHNSSLIKNEQTSFIKEEEVLEYLEKRKKVLDGLVISGGEPTIQVGLKNFITKVKQIGLKVKLDTNGYNPKVLQDLINNNLLDYIAMDIKGDFLDYDDICGKKIDSKKILESIEIIKKSNIDHEFRTTIIKQYHTIDKIKKIKELVKDSKYYLQNFKISKEVLNKNLTPFSEEELNLIKKEIEGLNIIVRGL